MDTEQTVIKVFLSDGASKSFLVKSSQTPNAVKFMLAKKLSLDPSEFGQFGLFVLTDDKKLEECDDNPFALHNSWGTKAGNKKKFLFKLHSEEYPPTAPEEILVVTTNDSNELNVTVGKTSHSEVEMTTDSVVHERVGFGNIFSQQSLNDTRSRMKNSETARKADLDRHTVRITKWINRHLAHRNIFIQDFNDLQDGTVLFQLLEVVTNKKFNGYHANPTNIMHKLDNHNLFMKTLGHFGINVRGVSPEDMYDVNVKLLLVLFMTLIKRYATVPYRGKDGKYILPGNAAPSEVEEKREEVVLNKRNFLGVGRANSVRSTNAPTKTWGSRSNTITTAPVTTTTTSNTSRPLPQSRPTPQPSPITNTTQPTNRSQPTPSWGTKLTEETKPTEVINSAPSTQPTPTPSWGTKPTEETKPTVTNSTPSPQPTPSLSWGSKPTEEPNPVKIIPPPQPTPTPSWGTTPEDTKSTPAPTNNWGAKPTEETESSTSWGVTPTPTSTQSFDSRMSFDFTAFSNDLIIDEFNLDDDFFSNMDEEVMLAGWLDDLDMSTTVPGSRQSMTVNAMNNMNAKEDLFAMDDFAELDNILDGLDDLALDLDLEFGFDF